VRPGGYKYTQTASMAFLFSHLFMNRLKRAKHFEPHRLTPPLTTMMNISEEQQLVVIP